MNGFKLAKIQQNNPQNNQNKFSVLVSNFRMTISPDAIINEIIEAIARRFKKTIIPIKEFLYPTYEFSLLFQNKADMETTLQLNGSWIFNNPIWIIRHANRFLNYQSQFLNLITSLTSNGVLDLSNLPQKWGMFGNDPKEINFNDQSFVEYLFYRIGSESRDRLIYIDTINLNNNQISNIQNWMPYFNFLPTLRKITLCHTKLSKEPVVSGWPFLTVVTDLSKKNEKNQNNQSSNTLFTQSLKSINFSNNQNNQQNNVNQMPNYQNQQNSDNQFNQNAQPEPQVFQAPPPPPPLSFGPSMGSMPTGGQTVQIQVEDAGISLEELQSMTQGNIISDIDPALLGLL